MPLRFQPVLGTARGHRAPSDAFGLRKYILDQEDNRVDFNWFNPFDQVPIRSIWPERDVNTQTGTTTSVLTLRWQNPRAAALAPIARRGGSGAAHVHEEVAGRLFHVRGPLLSLQQQRKF